MSFAKFLVILSGQNDRREQKKYKRREKEGEEEAWSLRKTREIQDPIKGGPPPPPTPAVQLVDDDVLSRRFNLGAKVSAVLRWFSKEWQEYLFKFFPVVVVFIFLYHRNEFNSIDLFPVYLENLQEFMNCKWVNYRIKREYLRRIKRMKETKLQYDVKQSSGHWILRLKAENWVQWVHHRFLQQKLAY